MERENKDIEHREITNEDQREKDKQIVIKIPPQLTALRKAAQIGDPYCEVIDENNNKTE
jgi:hypothetical protein